MSENHDPVVVEGATPESGGCPVAPGLTHPTQGDANQDWWPNRLNLKILAKNPAVANPMGEEFNYAVEHPRAPGRRRPGRGAQGAVPPCAGTGR